MNYKAEDFANVVALFPADQRVHPQIIAPAIAHGGAKIADELQTLLSRLEAIGADIAAAHVDAALHALRKQLEIAPQNSILD